MDELADLLRANSAGRKFKYEETSRFLARASSSSNGRGKLCWNRRPRGRVREVTRVDVQLLLLMSEANRYDAAHLTTELDAL